MKTDAEKYLEENCLHVPYTKSKNRYEITPVLLADFHAKMLEEVSDEEIDSLFPIESTDELDLLSDVYEMVLMNNSINASKREGAKSVIQHLKGE